ncbi:MAG TPA: TRAP transporter fused permease subunit [Verrucomicrobiales bacterium]|nr:TRAP transporter fused permease subunit [Verrucomicrobiales bacterium]
MSGSASALSAGSALRTCVGMACLLFHFGLLAYPLPPLPQRAIHLAFALALVLAWNPLPKPVPLRRTIDGLLLAGAAAAALYYLVAGTRLESRMEMIDPVFAIDRLAGGLLILLLLETVRRCVGWNLLSVLLLALVYGFFGRWFPDWASWPLVPDLLRFGGFSMNDAVENLTMTTDGVLGFTTATSVDLVFYFVVFGAFYSAIGGSRFLMDAGLRLAGSGPSNPARAAIVASSLMGSVSGSAVANVATTGFLTIPLMRRCGYTSTQAAGIEAIASTGGQLLPPIMGVAAFVMAERLEIPYPQIALAGLIPALAFYLTLFLTARNPASPSASAATTSRLPTESLRRRLYLLLPIAVLLALFAMGKPPALSAAAACGVCLLLGCLAPLASRTSLSVWRDALDSGIRRAAEVAVPIAAIGIVITVAVQSGLALRFSVELVEMSAGHSAAGLLLVMGGCLVLGMGLPTVAAYVLGATLLAPALLEIGIPELSAHFFIFYYCVLSMVTPPVALASATAAGLAAAPFLSVCIHALRLGVPAFLLPCLFVFEPALLAQGSVLRVVAAAAIGLTGALAAAAASSGRCFGPLTFSGRTFLGLAALAIFTGPLCVPGSALHDSFPLTKSLPGVAAVAAFCALRLRLQYRRTIVSAPPSSSSLP